MSINLLIENLAQEIANSKNNPIPLKTAKIKKAAPIRAATLAKYEACCTPDLWADLLALYTVSNGYSFFWYIGDQVDNPAVLANPWWVKTVEAEGWQDSFASEQISLNISISTFLELMENKKHRFLSFLDKDGDTYLPFDNAWELTICLKKRNGKIENNLYIFHAADPHLLDMKVTVAQYLALAYAAKGAKDWQYAYLIGKDTSSAEQLRETLLMLFPHIALDLSAFERKITKKLNYINF